uniref:Uncharacterized protein n=1 Tax=Dunaliella tertiolecta TaxID=3047 RepID=A0A7S3R6B7_DUNTE
MPKYSKYTIVVDNISSSTPSRDIEVREGRPNRICGIEQLSTPSHRGVHLPTCSALNWHVAQKQYACMGMFGVAAPRHASREHSRKFMPRCQISWNSAHDVSPCA